MQNISTRSNFSGLIYGPLLWFVHFLFSYVLVSISCAHQFAGATLGIAGATLLALIILLYGMQKNFQAWRAKRNTVTSGGTEDIPAFLALTSALLFAISFVATLWVALPMVVLPPCVN